MKSGLPQATLALAVATSITLVSVSKGQESLARCDPVLWNVTNANSMWTGDVKVLPSLNGEETYPDSFSGWQLTFEPGMKGETPLETAHVTGNLTRTEDYGTGSPPQCVTKYTYTCTKSTDVTITPVCNYLDTATAAECGCTSGGTNCREAETGSGCYFFQDPLAVHAKCSAPCVGFFWCDHFLLSYETASFSLIIEKSGILASDGYTMKMESAGKFDSGCDATSKATYQLQAFLYSGDKPNKYVDTPLVIVLGCLGGLLVILGGGWVIFFYCARPPKATKSQEQLDIEEADRTAASRSLCEPMMNVADANHEEPELRCPACHAVVQSKYDQFCLNTLCGKELRNYSKWTQAKGDVIIPNPRFRADIRAQDGE